MEKNWPSFVPKIDNMSESEGFTNINNMNIPPSNVNSMNSSNNSQNMDFSKMTKRERLNAFLNMDLGKNPSLPPTQKKLNRNQIRKNIDNFLKMDINAMNIKPYNPRNDMYRNQGGSAQVNKNMVFENIKNIVNNQDSGPVSSLNSTVDYNSNAEQKITTTKNKNIYYICGIDPNVIFIVAGFLQKFGTCYSIHSRIPPKDLTLIRGRHFTNIKDTNDINVTKHVIFLYDNPLNSLSNNNIWTVSHCSDLLFPNSTETVFSKFMNTNPNVINYLNENDDWLQINQFYMNYLEGKLKRSYPIIAINTSKLWDNLEQFQQVLNLPENSLARFPKKTNVNTPNIDCSIYDNLNHYINSLPSIKTINPNIIIGNFFAKLNKNYSLKFKINSQYVLQEPLSIELFINSINIENTDYNFTYLLSSDTSIQIKIKLDNPDVNYDYEQLNIGYSIS